MRAFNLAAAFSVPGSCGAALVLLTALAFPFGVPLPMAFDAMVARATVRRLEWPERIERVGVERLRLESAGDEGRPHDEDHAWDGVSLANVRDAWVRDVTFTGFAGSAVNVLDSASRVSVERCQSR